MADAMFTRSAGDRLGASAPPQPEMSNISARINHAHEILSQIGGHVGAGVATLWGPYPESPEKAAPKVVSIGVIADTIDGLDRLISRMQEIEQRASRLRNL